MAITGSGVFTDRQGGALPNWFQGNPDGSYTITNAPAPVQTLAVRFAYTTSDGQSSFVDFDVNVTARDVLPVPDNRVGVNLAGPEFANPSRITIDEMREQYAMGVRYMRLPLLWERLQPTLSGPLEEAYCQTYLDQALDDAATVGLKVIVDVHNYGRYNGEVMTENGSVKVLDFADLWDKLIRRKGNHPAWYAADLMNEWNNMKDAQGRLDYYSDYIPRIASQAAINAIRATGNKTSRILLEVGAYSGGWGIDLFSPTMWQVTDPENLIILSPHLYPDADGSGRYFDYDIEAASKSDALHNQLHGTNDYPASGGDVTPTRPQPWDVGLFVDPDGLVNRLKRIVAYLDKFGFKYVDGMRCMIGELGISNGKGPPEGDPRWIEMVRRAQAYAKSQGIVILYWAAGPAWGNYGYTLEPDRPSGIQAISMGIVQEYTGAPTQMLAAVTMAGRAAPGVTSGLCEIRARGVRPNPHPCTITWYKYNPTTDKFDTPAPEVVTTPAVPTIPAGFNPAPATFTWSAPEGVYECVITSPGLTFSSTYVASAIGYNSPPPAQPVPGVSGRWRVSTQSDILSLAASRPENAPGGAVLFDTAYPGPVYQLVSSGGQTKDFFPTDYDTVNKVFRLDRQAIADWYGAGADNGIPIAIRYDQSGRGRHTYFQNNGGRLMLDGGNGYPVERAPGNSSRRPSTNSFIGNGRDANGNGIPGISGQVILLDMSYVSGNNVFTSTSNIFGSIGVRGGTYGVRTDSLSDTSVKVPNATLPDSLRTDGFHQYAYWFDKDQGIRVYRDGIEVQRLDQVLGPMLWDFNDWEDGWFRFAPGGETNGDIRGQLIYINSLPPAQVASISSAMAAPYTAAWPAYTVPGVVVAPLDDPIPFTGTFTPKGHMIGANMAGGDQKEKDSNDNFSGPGGYGFDWSYGSTGEIDAMGAAGLGLVRIPVACRRLNADGIDKPLNNFNMARLAEIGAAAARNGMYFIIDIHNYSYVHDWTAQADTTIDTERGRYILKETVRRLAGRFRQWPNVIISPMNEPANSSPENTRDAMIACYNAVRSVSSTMKVLIQSGGYGNYNATGSWSGQAGIWTSFWATNPTNLMLEGHQYINQANDGLDPDAVRGKGGQIILGFAAYLRSITTDTFKPQGILGESGWHWKDDGIWTDSRGDHPVALNSNSGTPSVEGQALCDSIYANRDVMAGFAFWQYGWQGFYNRAVYTLRPNINGTIVNGPQLAILSDLATRMKG